MTRLVATSRPGNAMTDAFETGEERATEARGAVDRWETEGGAQETERTAGTSVRAKPRAQISTDGTGVETEG